SNYLQLPVNSPKGVDGKVYTNQTGGQMSYMRDVAPGQNPHVNYEPSLHGGLVEAEKKPHDEPEIRGKLVTEIIDRRNDYVQPRARYNTMMQWERDDLVHNMIDNLSQCERDVQERMLWHFFLIHDEYGGRVAEGLGMSVDDVKHLEPLPGQILTEEDQRRREKLGNNGGEIDPTVWGQWTSSVENYQATAEEVLGGMPDVRSVAP